MQFRLWLEETEKIYTENIYSKEIYYNIPFNIYKNPSKEELQQALNEEKQILRNNNSDGLSHSNHHAPTAWGIRGLLVDSTGDIYIWAETPLTHGDILEDILPIGDDFLMGFYIFNDFKVSMGEYGTAVTGDKAFETLKENPNYQIMMGQQIIQPSKKRKPYTFTGLTWKGAVKKADIVKPGSYKNLPYE